VDDSRLVNLEELLSIARDSVTVRRVFAEPYTQDGVTVIAAARVYGGGGGGGGKDHQMDREGEGGGFGVVARPSGAYVIKDGAVRWIPAIDVNRAISVAGAVIAAVLVTRVRLAKLAARRH
jgi:uncharacterized spore protein YtfJ